MELSKKGDGLRNLIFLISTQNQQEIFNAPLILNDVLNLRMVSQGK
ncbi:unnamed protein product [Paramecium octaurelia]|uniref:Uncharacterized protein n=1 Tax=Paramecium octaurelia TaxID=43137 RepID=A0A8S1U425_PAROT|nr:unnamed protein product [Paramecium octaurelia]